MGNGIRLDKKAEALQDNAWGKEYQKELLRLRTEPVFEIQRRIPSDDL